MGSRRLTDRNLQAKWRQPADLLHRSADPPRQRLATGPDRPTHALALEAGSGKLKPKGLGASLTVDHIDLLRAAVRHTKLQMPFHVDACVVLPDHLHCVWTLPHDDNDFSGRWRAIKTRFSKAIPAGERRSDSRKARGERGIWQRRFWEHTIRDERDYLFHVDYVHFNPVKHGLVTTAATWPYSTFHHAVKVGMYPADWGRGERD